MAAVRFRCIGAEESSSIAEHRLAAEYVGLCAGQGSPVTLFGRGEADGGDATGTAINSVVLDVTY